MIKKYLLLTLLCAPVIGGIAQDGQTVDGNIRYIFDKQIPDHQLQAELRNQLVWQDFLQNHGSWWVEFNENTGLPHRAAGEPIQVPGQDGPSKALSFLADNFNGWELPLEALILVNNRTSDLYTYVDFIQQQEGLDIIGSRATVRLNKDGKISLFGLDVYPVVKVNTTPKLSVSEAEQAAGIGLPNVSSSKAGKLKILPAPGGEAGYAFHLVYEVQVENVDYDQIPGNYYTLVDALTGKVWYRENKVHSCMPAIVNADVEGAVSDNPLQSAVNRGLPHLRVRINGNDYYTDENGHLNENLTAPVSASVRLEGRYARVIDDGTSNPASFNATINPGSNTLNFDPHADLTEISGYYHTNMVHDYMKSLTDPGFTVLDAPMDVNVNLTSDNCNAFYDGSSINFYAAGGGCPATALFNDIIYHEYGHGINYEHYDYWGGNFQNGALGEGYADVWGMMITENPVLGLGFNGGSSTYVRRYDTDVKVYPQDIVGEVHADGEIIAGAWWDTYRNLNDSMPHMAELFITSQEAVAMQTSGNEGILYRDILLDVLLADDNDGNFANGTPNDLAILQAFAKHGITLLANASVDHTEPLLTQDTLNTIGIDADVIVDFPAYLGDLVLHYRPDPSSNYNAVLMTPVSGNNYKADIPQQAPGTVVDYYFEVKDIFQNSATFLPHESQMAVDPNLPYKLMVGYEVKQIEDFDNFFTEWTINPDNDDDAVTGIWDITSPVASYSDFSQNATTLVQTGEDHTTDGANLNLCAVTGNGTSTGTAMGAQDVDDGKTTLETPGFDLDGMINPAFSYWRWYINNPAGGANPKNDPWQAFISNNGQNWVRVERTYTPDRSWRRNVVIVSDYVQPSANVFMRFVASDSLWPGAYLDGGSIVEAALDDFVVYDLATSNPNKVEEIEQFDFKLYPNPASDRLQVVALPDQPIDKVIITNISGQNCLEWLDIQRSQRTIDISALSPGIYFVKVHSGSDQRIHKLVIER